LLLEFVSGKFGLSLGVIRGVDATTLLIPVIFIFPVERTIVCLDGLAGFFTVDDHRFGSFTDKLSNDTDLFEENPGFKSIDFFSIPRLNLIFEQK